MGIAALCYRSPRWTTVANNVSAAGLTIPSFALIGVLIALVLDGLLVLLGRLTTPRGIRV